jgi:hypothetical protein
MVNETIPSNLIRINKCSSYLLIDPYSKVWGNVKKISNTVPPTLNLPKRGQAYKVVYKEVPEGKSGQTETVYRGREDTNPKRGSGRGEIHQFCGG